MTLWVSVISLSESLSHSESYPECVSQSSSLKPTSHGDHYVILCNVPLNQRHHSGQLNDPKWQGQFMTLKSLVMAKSLAALRPHSYTIRKKGAI